MYVQVACWNCTSCAMLKLWVLGLVRLKVRARPPLQYNSLTLITRPHSLETPTSRYSSSCTRTSGKYFKPFLTQPGSDVIIVLTEPEVYVPNWPPARFQEHYDGAPTFCGNTIIRHLAGTVVMRNNELSFVVALMLSSSEWSLHHLGSLHVGRAVVACWEN